MSMNSKALKKIVLGSKARIHGFMAMYDAVCGVIVVGCFRRSENMHEKPGVSCNLCLV